MSKTAKQEGRKSLVFDYILEQLDEPECLPLNILLQMKNKPVEAAGWIFYYLQPKVCLIPTISFGRKHIANLNQAF